MPSNRWRRDLRLFIMGVTLGILGNMFVEYWFAWVYPEGVPPVEARNYVYAIGITILLYLIYVRKTLKND